MKNDYIQHMPFVCQEYYHAVDKYPDFVTKFTADTTVLTAVENSLAIARTASDAEKKEGYSFERTINEEVLEVFEAYIKGEYRHCYQELAQCAAVCVRGMDWIRNHHKEAFNGGRKETKGR